MNKRNFLKIADFASYFLILASAVMIVLFQFSGNSDTRYQLFRLSVIFFAVGVVALMSMFVVRFFYAGKIDDDSFKLTSSQKILTLIKLIFSSILLGWIILVIFTI